MAQQSQSGRSPQPSPNAHCAPLASTAPRWCEGEYWEEQQHTHWKLPEPAWTWPSGLLLQQRETLTPPLRATEKGKPCLTPDSSPSTSTPPPCVTAASCAPLKKDVTRVHVDPALPPKNTQTTRGYSHIRTFKHARANCFTWLHRDREK